MAMTAVCRVAAWALVPVVALMASGGAGAAGVQGIGTSLSGPVPVVAYGPSDAVSIPVLAGSYYINAKMAGALPYWWDHPNLTAAVHSAPTTPAEDVRAVHAAIALWSSVLAERLPGITLTDITTVGGAERADIVVHLVSHFGGIVKGGNAICGSQKCLNILVKSDQPPGYVGKGDPDITDFDPLRIQREAMHELGHALGLGHPTPLASVDLMGYGWAAANPDVTPILSDCDLRGIASAFSWFFNHEPPHASAVAEVIC